MLITRGPGVLGQLLDKLREWRNFPLHVPAFNSMIYKLKVRTGLWGDCGMDPGSPLSSPMFLYSFNFGV